MIQRQPQDKIRETGSNNTTTGHQLSCGHSSDDEMCFGGMYRYPASGSNLFCPF
jgi:hypothetical protein